MLTLWRIAVVIGFVGAGIVLAQELKRCAVKQTNAVAIKYRLGLTERGGEIHLK
jgi:hypothetical protein